MIVYLCRGQVTHDSARQVFLPIPNGRVALPEKAEGVHGV